MKRKLLSLNINNLKMLAFSMALFGFSAANAQYCEPVDDCTDGDLILNVEFAGIENPSDCSPNGYGDYTADVAPAEVLVGETYTMAVEVGSGWSTETVGVWIDFDNSETFDESEFYLIGTGSGSVVEADVAIPSDVSEGTYRMRIAVKADEIPYDDPCQTVAGFGEFEDYLVNVTAELSVSNFDFTNSLAIFKTGETLNIQAGTNISNVAVYDLTGKLIATQQDVASRSTTLSLSAANQVLLVKVQSQEGYTVTKNIIF
ncbi:Regulatory P domain of the subtilisin-like proprotein convertases and other protease [unidentified eubacterium SCB49]|nr:Regulatory P domain of the subtilisin-like proprotein convertases and other protease [unidentified eubacterium SCB49]